MNTLLGQKLLQTTIDRLEATGPALTGPDIKTLELMLLADDLFGSIKKYASQLAPHIMPVLKPIVQTYAPMLTPLLDSFVTTKKTSDGITIKKRY